MVRSSHSTAALCDLHGLHEVQQLPNEDTGQLSAGVQIQVANGPVRHM